MANLFGIDIASLVYNSVKAAGGVRSGELIRSVPGLENADNPTAEPPSTVIRYRFEGFIEKKSIRRQDTLIVATIDVLTIFGASLNPVTVPGVNDRAELDGTSYELVRLIQSDPAAALYEFEVS